jgi:hypothetical protein|mmetsp:Transcript_21011/g.46217  ORF Transcript_21011/g.46217 Transcript_21011/m.46217 type:complete len:90 (+) Transcript_21011:651-920(+)
MPFRTSTKKPIQVVLVPASLESLALLQQQHLPDSFVLLVLSSLSLDSATLAELSLPPSSPVLEPETCRDMSHQSAASIMAEPSILAPEM